VRRKAYKGEYPVASVSRKTGPTKQVRLTLPSPGVTSLEEVEIDWKSVNGKNLGLCATLLLNEPWEHSSLGRLTGGAGLHLNQHLTMYQ
jgi:hypothetical protein